MRKPHAVRPYISAVTQQTRHTCTWEKTQVHHTPVTKSSSMENEVKKNVAWKWIDLVTAQNSKLIERIAGSFPTSSMDGILKQLLLSESSGEAACQALHD